MKSQLTSPYNFSALALGILISIIFFGKFVFRLESSLVLDLLQFISLLLAFVGILSGLIKYHEEKEKEKSKEIIELVAFFRNEILPLHFNIINILREKKLDVVQISLRNPTMEFILKNYIEKVRMQHAYVWKSDVNSTSQLNTLEEFALRVYLLNAEDEKSLFLVRYTYCVILEQLTLLILAHREMISGNSMYQNSLNLYKVWEPSVDMASHEERLKSFDEKYYALKAK